MTYNLHEIMCKAWKLFRKGIGTFAECLHRAWNSAKAEPINAQHIAEAQQTAGIEEECGRGQTGRSRGVKSCTAQEPLSKSS